MEPECNDDDGDDADDPKQSLVWVWRQEFCACEIEEASPNNEDNDDGVKRSGLVSCVDMEKSGALVWMYKREIKKSPRFRSCVSLLIVAMAAMSFVFKWLCDFLRCFN